MTTNHEHRFVEFTEIEAEKLFRQRFAIEDYAVEQIGYTARVRCGFVYHKLEKDIDRLEARVQELLEANTALVERVRAAENRNVYLDAFLKEMDRAVYQARSRIEHLGPLPKR